MIMFSDNCWYVYNPLKIFKMTIIFIRQKNEIKCENSYAEIWIYRCIHNLATLLSIWIHSTVVSAKLGNGSVHQALQTFVRYILEKHNLQRRWQPVSSKEESKKSKDTQGNTLTLVGISQVNVYTFVCVCAWTWIHYVCNDP